VVANLPFAKDRRVTREASSLIAAGWDVTVVCPYSAEELGIPPEAAGVELRTYRLPVQGNGVASFAAEFLLSFVSVAGILVRLRLRRRINVVQFCNPPDIFFPLFPMVARLGGHPVLDHHDVSPEMYLSRTERPFVPLVNLLRFFERMSQRWAHAVVATNESFAARAKMVGVPTDRIVVVRNGPTRLEIEIAHGRVPSPSPVIGYLGVLGSSDGVESFVKMARHVHDQRQDATFVLVGDGPALPSLRQLVERLGMSAVVRFTGWLSAPDVHRELADFTVAVQPDPQNDMNEISTMAKTVEYIARGLPVVAVDMVETRETAGDAAVYVRENDPRVLAEVVLELLASPERRLRMSQIGRERFENGLAWDHQQRSYLALFEQMLSTR